MWSVNDGLSRNLLKTSETGRRGFRHVSGRFPTGFRQVSVRFPNFLLAYFFSKSFLKNPETSAAGFRRFPDNPSLTDHTVFLHLQTAFIYKISMMKNQKFFVACVGYPYPWLYGPVWPWSAICLYFSILKLWLSMYIRMVIFEKNIMMKNQKFCVACVGYPYPWIYGPVWSWLAICLYLLFLNYG